MMRAAAIGCAALALVAAPVAAQSAEPAPASQAASARRLGLSEALRLAREHQPTLRAARAAVRAADAQADEATAPLLPSVQVGASYARTTANYTPRPGAPEPPGIREDSFDTFDLFDFGVRGSQLIYDFGASWNARDAAREAVRAERANETAQVRLVERDTRVSYFEARAARAFLAIAEQTLENTERHLAAIEGFVRAGTRPEIDLAQARADRGAARLDVIHARNASADAEARLCFAIGLRSCSPLELVDDALAPLVAEREAVRALATRAARTRPELAALVHRSAAERELLDAHHGALGPRLSLDATATESGTELDDLAWNWSAGVTLVWPLYEGGATIARIGASRATLTRLDAEHSALLQRIELEIGEAQRGVQAASAALQATEESVTHARERLRLADGRYRSGVGSLLELADARLAAARSEVERVRAHYQVSVARAHLIYATGIDDDLALARPLR